MTRKQAQAILKNKFGVSGMTLYRINSNDRRATDWMIYIEGADPFQVRQNHGDARFDGVDYCRGAARGVAWNKLAIDFGLIGADDELD